MRFLIYQPKTQTSDRGNKTRWIKFSFYFET